MTGSTRTSGTDPGWIIGTRSEWTAGRVRLTIGPGREAVVAVHDPGSPRAERERWLGAARQSWGAWVYAQRGHAPSEWAAGGLYRASDFAIDLVRLLRDRVTEPCLLAGKGAGGLIALLAAAAAPDLVTGLHLVAGSSGWGADPARLVSDDGVLNRQWLATARSAPVPASGDGDDSALACGPAEMIYRPAVSVAAARIRVPWSAQGRHFLQPCLPPSMRAAAVLLPPLRQPAVARPGTP